MTDPYQQNPWADSTNQPRSDPWAPANPYAQPDPYAQPGQYPQYGQPAWSDPSAPASPTVPAPFVSPDTPSYASGSSPVPTQMPAGPEYGYGPSSAPSYGYAAGYGGYGSTMPTYVPVMPQPRTNGMAIGSMVVSIVGMTLVACYGVGGLIGVVGAILGHVARRQIRNNRESGDGMAKAGIIVGWIALALGVIVIATIVVFFAYLINNAPTSSSYDSGNGNGFNTLRGALI
jgi:Domain of unknown function (DUF4190)